MDLGLPGEILTYDYRNKTERPATAEIPRPLRVVQWNIERGYKLDAVISTLEKLDADILCLQEIDIGNERSGGENHGQIIAQRLGLNGGIAIEFQELRSPCRNMEQQGGGIHGNAVYSKFDMSFRVIDHAHQPYNWPRDGALLGEPRTGRRCTLVAEISVPKRPPVLAYSAHFECFTGIIGRVGQLCDLLLDSRNMAANRPHQLVFGDLNTFAHSLARFSPRYANGWYRFRTLGMSEPEWWMKNILSWYADDGDNNRRLNDEGLPGNLRFSDEILRAAVNPGWFDPFDTVKDITISNHAGWMTAKADWAFVRQFSVVRHWMENRDFDAADHRCLVLEIEYAHLEVLDEHRTMARRIAHDLELRRTTRIWAWCSLAAATVLSCVAVRLARSSMVSGLARR
ncbi:hypothetical protein GGI11_001877 [Coemansia sp. RSA 2049]|nr:hypothetical protein GGI11_001877 [Coemansia sp. RSA 2049]